MNLPDAGWIWTFSEDLGEYGAANCEAPAKGRPGPCGETLRCIHGVTHPTGLHLTVGCVCVGRLTRDDQAKADSTEAFLKARAARRAHWLDREWKRSKMGNPYLSVGGSTVTIFNRGGWQYVIRTARAPIFSTVNYSSADLASLAAFDRLYPAKVSTPPTVRNRALERTLLVDRIVAEVQRSVRKPDL